MGRPAKGPRVKYKRGWAYVHFTWESHPYRLALGLQKGSTPAERRSVEEAASRAYAQVVSGERRAVRRQPGKLLDLAELFDEWLETKRGTLDVTFFPTVESYTRRFIDYFVSLDKITEATGENFGVSRLGQVLRKTANRELSYLREFLAWCKRHGALATVPHIPRLPIKAQGVRAGKQRAKFVHITREQGAAILALLPAESKTIAGQKWPLRARFEFAWETALRPGTLGELRVPDHWRPGSRILEIPDGDDKARWGREVDLTDRALAILAAVAPARGVIFGHHAFYKAIKRAAAVVLGPLKGKLFAPYDFRHGRAKDLLDAGAPIRGVSYVLGHKLVSTTDIYTAPERSAGQQALEAGGGFSQPNRRTKVAPTRKRKK